VSVQAGADSARLLRDRTGVQRVTNIELFFDLVYVFAVTQLSHRLLPEPTVTVAAQTALLLAMVWLVWAYTTWVTNWLDPERLEVRRAPSSSPLRTIPAGSRGTPITSSTR
jgi:low temperature requirement protein LtrA